MKRRTFIKSAICLGCAGVLGVTSYKLMNSAQNFHGATKADLDKFRINSVKKLPTQIRLDVCNMCQLDCVKCYMRRNESVIEKECGGFGYLPFENFKKLCDENPQIEKMEISNNGEIFLNPDLDKILQYAYYMGIDIHVSGGVNLNTVSEQTLENLVKYQVKILTVSIDGATPETYSIYRRGGDFDTVINNCKIINKFKQKYDSFFPELNYKFILFGHNEHEIQAAKELAKKLNMNIQFASNYAVDYSPLKNVDKVIAQTGQKSFEGEIYDCFKKFSSNVSDWYFCTDFFAQPQFNWNGDLLGCCLNFLRPFKSNLFKDGLLKALNDTEYLYSKLMLTNFDFKPLDGSPCSICSCYKNLIDNNYPFRLRKIL